MEQFIHAVANVFEYTSSRWHELLDMNGEPIKILDIGRMISALHISLESE